MPDFSPRLPRWDGFVLFAPLQELRFLATALLLRTEGGTVIMACRGSAGPHDSQATITHGLTVAREQLCEGHGIGKGTPTFR